MIVYMDDMLIMGDVVRDHVTVMVAIMEGLGFIINTDRSMCPTQRLGVGLSHLVPHLPVAVYFGWSGRAGIHPHGLSRLVPHPHLRFELYCSF